MIRKRRIEQEREKIKELVRMRKIRRKKKGGSKQEKEKRKWMTGKKTQVEETWKSLLTRGQYS